MKRPLEVIGRNFYETRNYDYDNNIDLYGVYTMTHEEYADYDRSGGQWGYYDPAEYL